MNRDETMTTSSTGGMKGSKLAQLSAIDPQALLALAECAGAGAKKYSRHNYLKGYDWSLSMDALMRHALQFQAGEDYDPESGQPHMAHAAWHAMTLVSFLLHGLGTDDRASTQLDGVKPLSVKREPAWMREPEPEVFDNDYAEALGLLRSLDIGTQIRDSDGEDWVKVNSGWKSLETFELVEDLDIAFWYPVKVMHGADDE